MLLLNLAEAAAILWMRDGFEGFVPLEDYLAVEALSEVVRWWGFLGGPLTVP